MKEKLTALSKKDKAILKGMREAMKKNIYGWINISDDDSAYKSDFIVHRRAS